MRLLFKGTKLSILFPILIAILFAGSIFWYNYSTIAESTNPTEQEYYKDLLYVVNEMNNQMADLENTSQDSREHINSIQNDFDFVQDLFEPLEDPPEQFVVAHLIANKMHNYYSQYVTGLSDSIETSFPFEKGKQSAENFRLEYANFQENFELLQLIGEMNSINFVCH